MKYDNIQAIVFGQHCMNTLGQVRSLGELGLRPDVLWVSHDLHSPKGSKYIRHFYEFDSFDKGLCFIESQYRSTKDVFIFSDSDAVITLLNSNIHSLPGNFHFFNAGDDGRLLHYMPKFAQCELASRHGFKVPKSELVRKGEFPSSLSFPVFTKAPDSNDMSWKSCAMICRNKDELTRAFEIISSDIILLQEFIEKDNEVAIEGISFNGGENVYAPIQGEYLRIQDGGFGTWKKNEAYDLGEDFLIKVQGMMKEICYSGVFEIEFLRTRSDNLLYFLEINFRFTQYNYALTRMGVNLCKEYIESELDNSYRPKLPCIKSQVVINEPKDFKTYVTTGKIGFQSWLKDMHHSDCYYLFNKDDKLYVIRYLMNSVFIRICMRLKSKLKRK